MAADSSSHSSSGFNVHADDPEAFGDNAPPTPSPPHSSMSSVTVCNLRVEGNSPAERYRKGGKCPKSHLAQKMITQPERRTPTPPPMTDKEKRPVTPPKKKPRTQKPARISPPRPTKSAKDESKSVRMSYNDKYMSYPDIDKEVEAAEGPSDRLSCVLCNANPRTRKGLINHVRTHYFITAARCGYASRDRASVTNHIKANPSCHCYRSRNVYSIAKRRWGDFLRIHSMNRLEPPSLEPILFPFPEAPKENEVSTTTPPRPTAGSAGLDLPVQGKYPSRERPSTSTAGSAGLGHPAQGKHPRSETVYSRLGSKRSRDPAARPSSSPVGPLAREEAGAGDTASAVSAGSAHPSGPERDSPPPGISGNVVPEVLSNIRTWYDAVEYRRHRDEELDQQESRIYDDLADAQRRQRRLLEELEDVHRRRAAVRRQEKEWSEEMSSLEYSCLRHWDDNRRVLGPPPLARAQPGGQALEFSELLRRHTRRNATTVDQGTILVRPLGRESSDRPGRMW